MHDTQDSFNKNGFIIFKEIFNPMELDILNNEYNILMHRGRNILKYISENKINFGDFYQNNERELIIVPEAGNPYEICRFEHIAPNSKIITDLAIEKTNNLINKLAGEPFVLFKDKCNIKQPGGGAFTPHQDIAAYYHFKPQFHITAAVMLDDATIQNGCLEMAIAYKDHADKNTRFVDTCYGSQPFFDFYKGGKNNGDIKTAISKAFRWKKIEAKKGDVILFTSYVPHCSQKNVSNSSRRNFFFTFNPHSDGDIYQFYYSTKMKNFNNPIFHVSTPTLHDGKELMNDEKL